MSADSRNLIAWKPFRENSNSASARLRSFLPCDYMRKAGWPCEMFQPSHLDEYQLVVFQKAYDEESISLAEQLSARGVKTVFDLCDNHFYNPRQISRLAERAERLRRMVMTVDAVSVSTQELANIIERKDAFVIDDAVDVPSTPVIAAVSRFAAYVRGLSQTGPLRVVWYGNAGSKNPPFGLFDLPKVLPHLEALNAEMPVELTVISNSENLFQMYLGQVQFPVRYHEWNRDTFPLIFKRHDVCIIPVTPNPFTICKTHNRLVLSLMLGVPVIADEIPSYSEFSDFVLFSDWQNNLRTYATNRRLSRRHVRDAQRYIRSKYNEERVVSQWSGLFKQVLGGTAGGGATNS